ncbi:endonuclease V [Kribbella sp. VKM Ac-2569]|uniref:deoxyribonuclease V n=1 Tax=Kribbella sp. VKM Ac-2569 TaxID=2512220 RepID=UPI00102C06D3|nr:deoxyribonuclease V [Kribbella sp. VKM Ac-2569]RZT26816.1 endonuclease V [Kribbella sp. VKM Ac-2569]
MAPERRADLPVTNPSWPSTPAEAIAVQEELRGLVDPTDTDGPARYVAGLDVAYDEDRLAAAVVVLDLETLDEVERAVVRGETTFPYVPGLFAFREVPALLAALEQLVAAPELLVCDGQGLAHPRRFGLACHLGVLTGIPAIGAAKTTFVGSHGELAQERGSTAELVDGGGVVGAAVRTQAGVKPVYVSVGHRVSLERAVDHVLRLAPRYRLPETTRLADRACREGLLDG